MRQRFLIVGQGLAGSLLAKILIEREQSVTVVDNGRSNSASRVAAGIVNPLTGQRLVLAKDVKQCLPAAIAYYEKLAKQFNQSFYFPKTLLRLYQSTEDKDRYLNRRIDESYRYYLGENFDAGESGEEINDSLGGFTQQLAGYLDITLLLETLKTYFRDNAHFTEIEFNYSKLSVTETEIRWQDETFDHVIFCEGALAVNNPWFRWLPFQLSKGEIVSVESRQDFPEHIISKGNWLLPVNAHKAKFGASYAWDWVDDEPTEQVKDQLLSSCQQLLASSFDLSICDHKAGIRPTTKDKRPFIGSHPGFSKLHCFNGFGSKGSSLIPYYAECFAETLLTSKSLPMDVDIKRFEGERFLVVRAARLLAEHIKFGDTVIDATVGNGFDTELMARCVGEAGRVIGFDIQQQALTNTQTRLVSSGIANRATLIEDNHVNMKRHLNDESLKNLSTIVFNLGYLPGFDKSRTTLAETTLLALQQAAIIINHDGLIQVMTYSGHECGKKETKIVKQWVNTLDKGQFSCDVIRNSQSVDAPTLFLITKLRNNMGAKP